MVIDVDTWKKLKDRVESAKRERDKAEGTLTHLRGRLATEFDCKTTEEAKEKIARLEEEIAERTTSFNQQLTEFQEKWSEKL